MNYCSIQEAWGQNDYITNEYKKYNSKYNDSVNSVNSVNSVKCLSVFINSTVSAIPSVVDVQYWLIVLIKI